MWRRPWRFGILECIMVGKLRPPPLTFLGTPNRHQSLFRLVEFLHPFGNGLGFASIHARTCQTQQRALAAHRQINAVTVKHGLTVRFAHRPDLLAKKSRSTVSCPILA